MIVNQDYYQTLLELYASLKPSPHIGLELGTGWGTSAEAFLTTFDQANLVSVDQADYHNEWCRLRELFSNRIDIRKLNTQWCTVQDLATPNYLYDYIYIDASHDYKSVKNDIEQTLPLLSSGGVIVFDDYGMTGKTEEGKQHGVKQAVDELIPYKQIFNKRTIVAFRKV